MHHWIIALIYLIAFCVWVAIVIHIISSLRWRRRTQRLVERELELQEQQLAVLREINETLKQLREWRG